MGGRTIWSVGVLLGTGVLDGAGLVGLSTWGGFSLGVKVLVQRIITCVAVGSILSVVAVEVGLMGAKYLVRVAEAVGVKVKVGVDVRVKVTDGVGVAVRRAKSFKGWSKAISPPLSRFQFNVIGVGPGRRSPTPKTATAKTNREATTVRPLRLKWLNLGRFAMASAFRMAVARPIYFSAPA